MRCAPWTARAASTERRRVWGATGFPPRFAGARTRGWYRKKTKRKNPKAVLKRDPPHINSLNANWIIRGKLLCPDTTPNCGLPKLELGGANCGVLVILKNSARNCSFSFSVSFVFLCSEMSSSLVGSERNPESVRPALPKVNAGG